jgi:hypothetical protein
MATPPAWPRRQCAYTCRDGRDRFDGDLHVVAASRIMDSYRESARLGRRVADIERALASDVGTRLIQELDLRDASYRA